MKKGCFSYGINFENNNLLVFVDNQARSNVNNLGSNRPLSAK